MSKDPAAAALGKRGGMKTKATKPKDYYKNIIKHRWASVCQRCRKSKKQIEAKNLQCIYKVEKVSKTHVFLKK